MWLTATMLPTALTRINRLLKADALRREINCMTHIGVEDLPRGNSLFPSKSDFFVINFKNRILLGTNGNHSLW